MRLAIAIVMATATSAHAERVTVKVVEIAGGVAYVEPGASAGIAVGTKLVFGTSERTVAAASSTTASFELAGLALSLGQTGSATTTAQAGTHTVTLAKVHDASAFREQWPAPVTPATTQNVKPVPLGAGVAGGAVHLELLGRGYASAGRDARAAQAEARVITSFDVLQDRPFAIDADVAVRAFDQGFNASERTPVFVRAAQLRYGDAADPMLVVGRLRWAASSVGMLDGGRAIARVGDFELAAFGGLVPDAVNGKPETSASRFGAEAVYDLAEAPWQPRVALTAVGSTWQGQVDERLLALTADASHGGLTLDGWAEGQAFAAGNPWNAKSLELTGAGASASWRDPGEHVGVDLSFLRPERSLRLAAALPADWLCARVPEAGAAAESCQGSTYWTTAAINAGLRRGPFAVDVIASVGQTHDVTSSTTSSVYVRGELALGGPRLVFGGSAGKAEFATWDAGELGLGAALTRAFDAEVRYRAELLDYVAATSSMLLHSVEADLRYHASASFDLATTILGTTGQDRDAVAALVTLAWRPLP